MAKVGTAHLEIKPVLNEEALEALGVRIEQTVRDAVARGLSAGPLPVTAVTTTPYINVTPGTSTWSGGIGEMKEMRP